MYYVSTKNSKLSIIYVHQLTAELGVMAHLVLPLKFKPALVLINVDGPL